MLTCTFCFRTEVALPTEMSEGSECEGESLAMKLPRSQSERLLAVNREQITQERELREKYHDLVNIMCNYDIVLL